MKNLFYFLFFSVLFGKAQNSGHIEYLHITDFGRKYQTTAILEFNLDTSKYLVRKSSSQKSEELIVSSNDVNSLEVEVPESDRRPANFTNRSSQLLLSHVPMFKKLNLTVENIPDIKWRLKNEYKSFNDIKCQKAEGYFRGRNYTVWFAPEIPVPFGPWKLQGLPGLILEAQDDRNELFFTAQKITLTNVEEIKIPNVEKATPLKTFITEVIPERFNDLEALINSRNSDRNTTITLSLFNRETEKEIIYEWEENKGQH